MNIAESDIVMPAIGSMWIWLGNHYTVVDSDSVTRLIYIVEHGNEDGRQFVQCLTAHGWTEPVRVWMVEQMPHRLATQAEIDVLRHMDGAPHVTLACACGCGWWSCKNIALSASGHYNGMRNIFFHGKDYECACPLQDMRCVVPVEGLR